MDPSAPTPNGGEYRRARTAVALSLAALVIIIVVGDAFGLARAVDPFTLGALLLSAAGLLAVDLPALRR